MRDWGFSRTETVWFLLTRAFPIVALAALVALGDARRRVPALISILLYCTLLHALTHAEARLSDPWRPLLYVITAAAVIRWWERPGRAGGRSPRAD